MSRAPNYIRSLNGMKITFLDIKPNMIRIDAILLHLAKTCRYHGMVSGWYSNAEHSILAAKKADNRKLARACLVHDFGEHITADVAGPVKKACPDYDALCSSVQEVMNYHFLGYQELPKEVKLIDIRLTASEQKVLRNAPEEDWDGIPFSDVDFQCWEWREAYVEITHYFRELFPEYRDAV